MATLGRFFRPWCQGQGNVNLPGTADLEPGLEQACITTNPRLVPCHFLDLRRIRDGHPDYTDPISNIQASEDGARAIGNAIWKIKQDNGIAQWPALLR